VRVVHYYPSALDGSGVTVALWAWAQATAAAGVDVLVATGPPGGERRWFDDDTGKVEIAHVVHRGRRRLTRYPRRLERLLTAGDILVLHEGWVVANFVGARAARSRSIPFVVMPHGVYELPWRSYLRGPVRLRERAEGALIERAAAVHLFFESEAGDVRGLAPQVRTLIAPTGFDVPAERWSRGGRYLAWIGRYDPYHKGLDLLVEAVGRLPEARRPQIRLRGYDYRGGQARLLARIAEEGVGPWVEVGPAIEGRAKVEFLLGAGGYVLPSRWESYGIALVEALALGVPTLASARIRMAPSLAEAGAALLAEPEPGALADGLQRLMEAPPALGPHARSFVAERLAWETVVPQYLDDLGRVTRES
jgi:glycosyltransferase involved in cell wall biosynthesis